MSRYSYVYIYANYDYNTLNIFDESINKDNIEINGV